MEVGQSTAFGPSKVTNTISKETIWGRRFARKCFAHLLMMRESVPFAGLESLLLFASVGRANLLLFPTPC